MANLSADEEDYCDTAEYRVGNKPGKARSGQASAAASGGGAGSSGGGGGSGGGSGGGGVSPGPGSASSSSAGPAQGQGSGLRSAISSGARRRRTRCRKCEACVRTECGECTFCKDMKKFGGPGKMKQSCIMRQCIAPILPHTAVCRICGEAGKEDAAEGEEEKFSMTLMECSICNEIVHPACLKIDDKEGVINDELPNCWECPKCNQEGKTGKQKRGPGFKYASNLPGSMLRECGERRRSEQDDAFPRRRSDEALKREHARSDDDADDDSDADSRFGSVGEDDDGDDDGGGGADEEEEEEEDEGRRRDRDEDEEAAAALEVSEAAAESVAAAGAVTPTVPAASDAAMLSDHSPASPPSTAGSASSPPPPEPPPPPLPTAAAVVAASAAVQHTPANANRKGTEDGVVVSKKRKEVDGVQQPLGQKKKVKVEKAEKLLRKKKQKAVEVNNGRVESGHRREGPAAWLERRGVASEQGRAWRGTDKQSSAAPDAAAAAAAAAGPSGRENERKPNKHSRDAATAGITGGSSGGGGGGGGVTAGEHRSKTRDSNDRVRPAKPHATSKASSWGLHKPEQNSVGNSSAGRNNANNNSSSSNGNSGDGGAANSTNKNHRAPLVKSEEDGENGNNRTPRLFSSSERLQKAAKSLNGIPRGGPAARQPQQQQLQQLQQQQQAAGLSQAQAPRLCGVNARLGGLPRPPSSVSPPKPHLLERHVIKPPLVSPPPDALPLGDGGSHPLRREAWLGVFRFLSHRDLCVCMRVCKTWNRWCCDRRLWAKIDLSRCKSVTPLMLSGIIKRQPSALDLSWSNVSKKQLAWLVNRLPGLKELVLSGCPWASVSALCGASWPPLRALDLRWAEGVKDAHIRDLLSPDSDYTPGAEDRLRGVSELRLAGLDITDASVALLVRLAAGLATLDLAHCAHLTDQAVNVLTAPGAPTRDTLRHLVLAGCARITDACLPLLVRCPHLSRADLRSCKLVTPEACQRLVTELCPQGTFALPEDRLILRVPSTGS